MTECCPLCGGNFASDDLILVPGNHRVIRNGVTAYLTPKQWELFARLHAARGSAVSKGALLEWIYQLEHDEPLPKIIDVLVMHVRRRIKPLDLQILTDYGFGFRLTFKGKSRVVKAAAAGPVLRSSLGSAAG